MEGWFFSAGRVAVEIWARLPVKGNLGLAAFCQRLVDKTTSFVQKMPGL